MKVSVIISAYNEEKVIRDCLNSLQEQDYPSMEIIVVNDGSTDGTAAIVDKFPEIILLTQPHQGPALGRNLGASAARGEILIFLDADMTFKHDFVSKMVKPITDKKTIGTFCREVYISNPENIWARGRALYRNNPLYGNIFPENIPDHWNIFRAILKSEFDFVGGFDNIGYGEDITLFKKLQKPAIAAHGAVFYHHNPSSLREVFENASWIGKGERIKEYEKRILFRYFPLFIFLNAIRLSIRRKDLFLFAYAQITDYGVLFGLISRLFKRKHHQ